MADNAGGGPQPLFGADLAEVEAALGRIPSVTAARVVTAPGGRIAEVHVLAKPDRSPKQVVRDVQSVALASFGLEVDYRTVSVVQLDAPPVEGELAAAAAAKPPRAVLMRLTFETSGYATEVRARVALGGAEHTGIASGPASAGMRLVARAILDAVREQMREATVDVEVADVVPVGPWQVAVAVLRTAKPRGDEVVSGSCVVRRDQNDAMARATLAALNRLIGA